MKTQNVSEPRPLQHLRAIEQRYPQIWEHAATCRALKDTEPAFIWPDWCYLPLAASYALVK